MDTKERLYHLVAIHMVRPIDILKMYTQQGCGCGSVGAINNYHKEEREGCVRKIHTNKNIRMHVVYWRMLSFSFFFKSL